MTALAILFVNLFWVYKDNIKVRLWVILMGAGGAGNCVYGRFPQSLIHQSSIFILQEGFYRFIHVYFPANLLR